MTIISFALHLVVIGALRDFHGLGEFTYLTGATEDKLPESKDKFFIWGRGLHVANATVMRCGLEKEFGLYVRGLRD